MHVTLRRSIAAGAALLLAQVLAGPVAAECIYVPPFPKISPAIATAREIIVGEVVTDFDPAELGLTAETAPDRALRVTEVLRGPAKVGDLRDARYLEPNWPWTMSPGSTEPYPSCGGLPMWPGTVIAIAFDALQPGGVMHDNGMTWVQPPTRYNAAALIEGDAGGGLSRFSIERLREMAALPPTDTAMLASTASASGSGPNGLSAVLLVAAIGGTLLGLRRGARPRDAQSLRMRQDAGDGGDRGRRADLAERP